jgi:sugar transferase (PEP-CTERM/EpsH1 system associated)
MKILFVCHRVPFPPRYGGNIRAFNVVKHFSERGHEVTVASLARTGLERDEAQGLAVHCAKAIVEVIPDHKAWPQMFARLAGTQPSSFGYFHSRRLAQRVRAELQAQSFELIFAHSSSAAPYVVDAHATVKVLDYCDMDSQKWREYAAYRAPPVALGYWLEAVKLERAERRLARKFDLCTCATRAELQSLRDLGISTAADWFPNGVDAEYFNPVADYDPNLVVFVGRMDYYPNQQAVIEFCRDVLPRLRERHPELRFSIVGAEPPRSIRNLALLPGVSVSGSVPDVRPHVQRAALSVAPLAIARGTPNKILESMAMGVPVVCSVAASRGVDARPGEDLLTASNADEYVQAMERILQSRENRNRLAERARSRAVSHHSWRSSMERLDRVLARAFAPHGAADEVGAEAAGGA